MAIAQIPEGVRFRGRKSLRVASLAPLGRLAVQSSEITSR